MYKQFIKNSALIGLFFFLVMACKENEQEILRINNIQVIGSHNSYKQAIDPALLTLIQQTTGTTFEEYQYSHSSLTEQLETYGLRNLEIDVLFDPKGGKFAKPYGLEALKQQGIPTQPYDSLGIMQKLGFKVLHIPDIDFRTSCMLLVDCLQEIKAWSDANPNHLPIAITFNAKTTSIEKEGFQKLQPFTTEVFDAFDKEILSVLPKEKIITPDDVRGDFSTLEEAVRSHNWPALEESRGKFILVLDEGGEKQQAYIKGHPSLKDRLLFVPANAGTPEAAFMIRNYPIRDQDTIKALVKAGYLVRTRADEDTQEARKGDYTRFKAALSSGAHFISTDYYKEDKALKTGYKIEMPNAVVGRINPILKLKKYTDKDLE